MSLCLCTVNLMCLCKLFLPCSGGAGWWEQAAAGCFPSPGHLDSDNPRQVRIWLASFPWRQALFIRTECSDAFQSCFCPPIHLQEAKVIFLQYFLLVPPVTLESLILQVACTEPPAIVTYSSGFPLPSLISMVVSAWVCSGEPTHPCSCPSDSPVLGVPVCPVSSSFL